MHTYTLDIMYMYNNTSLMVLLYTYSKNKKKGTKHQLHDVDAS